MSGMSDRWLIDNPSSHSKEVCVWGRGKEEIYKANTSVATEVLSLFPLLGHSTPKWYRARDCLPVVVKTLSSSFKLCSKHHVLNVFTCSQVMAARHRATFPHFCHSAWSYYKHLLTTSGHTKFFGTLKPYWTTEPLVHPFIQLLGLPKSEY